MHSVWPQVRTAHNYDMSVKGLYWWLAHNLQRMQPAVVTPGRVQTSRTNVRCWAGRGSGPSEPKLVGGRLQPLLDFYIQRWSAGRLSVTLQTLGRHHNLAWEAALATTGVSPCNQNRQCKWWPIVMYWMNDWNDLKMAKWCRNFWHQNCITRKLCYM